MSGNTGWHTTIGTQYTTEYTFIVRLYMTTA